MFVRDQTEFIATLNVLPEYEEYGLIETYSVTRPFQKLNLKITGDLIEFVLYQEGIGEPIFYLKLKNCPEARIVERKGRKFIDFAPPDGFNTENDYGLNMSYGVSLSVDPYISIAVF